MFDTTLVDAHCHALTAEDVSPAQFERWCTEADQPHPSGVSATDGQVGLAIRRWCAPVLDLPTHVPLDTYLAQRAELGGTEVTRRLLHAADLSHLLVDTGLSAPGLLGLPDLETASGAVVSEVVRLETLAERIAASGTSAAAFGTEFQAELARLAETAVAVKSIAAYRHGLRLTPEPPSKQAVRAATSHWLGSGAGRVDDPVLLRFLLWSGVETGLPVQVHTGFGDRDLSLSLADPALLQPWLAAVEPTGVAVVLLHCYPYQRHAAWLAQVYPHVYVDLGLALTHAGGRAAAVLGEFFELTPFGKLLFSTDAYRLPELSLVGAAVFRHALTDMLGSWMADDTMSATDAQRIATAVGGGNARRVYGLDAPAACTNRSGCPQTV
jgi:predicted TIM-barrel fold metal-dependent hydrolase